MKKLFSLSAALSAALLLAACGGAGNVNEKTDPAALKSEKVGEKAWASAFASQENYCVKTVLTSSPTQKDGTMSEVTTMNFCNDGEKVCFTMCVKEGDTTLYEAESYADLTDKKAIWSRSKEDGEWSEWDSETYTSEQFAEFFKGFSIPAFARERFAQFSYSESENGYTMSEEALSESAVNEYVSSVLSVTPSDSGELTAKKLILKFTGGKPSACLFELGSGEPSADSSGNTRRDHLPAEPVPLPLIHVSRHGHIPRILIEIRPVPREKTPTEPAPPESPSVRLSCSQLFYNFGKARVTFPEDLPPLGEE